MHYKNWLSFMYRRMNGAAVAAVAATANCVLAQINQCVKWECVGIGWNAYKTKSKKSRID